MARLNRADRPSIDDWKRAASVIRMIRAFEEPIFRASMEDLARTLEREGIAAHRSADRIEKRSEFTQPVEPQTHSKDTIVAKLSIYTEADSSHAATEFVGRLHNEGLEDPDRLRNQAAILLDAAETVDRLIKWYASRLKDIKARNLTTDTIVAIMLEWELMPRETSKRFKTHGIVVSEGAIKQAQAKGRGQSLPGHEPTLISFVPALHRRR